MEKGNTACTWDSWRPAPAFKTPGVLRALITEKGGEEDTMSLVISLLDEVIKIGAVFSTILFELSGFCLFCL